jgi:hypothetical protein
MERKGQVRTPKKLITKGTHSLSSIEGGEKVKTQTG